MKQAKYEKQFITLFLKKQVHLTMYLNDFWLDRLDK